MTEITVDKYDREGVFVVVIETASQGPIALETEGEHSSFEEAQARASRAMGGAPVRFCICRLVPVSANELVILDMKRMQK